MFKFRFSIFISFLFITFFGCQSNKKELSADRAKSNKDYKIIAYVAGWNDFESEDIDAEHLTHINYAFANIINGKVSEGEGKAERDSLNYIKLRSLKNRNPNLKIIVSIGGWGWSGGFSDAVSTDSSRKILTKSAIDYLNKYDLDGLDFDWEYPSLPGIGNPHKPEDKDNFVLMLKSMREALDSLSKETNKAYLTSIASGGFDEYIDTNDLGEAHKYLDFVNIMTYDFHGGWDSITGHHTSLYNSKDGELSADRAVKKHVEAGVPIEKLVMGIAFYGRSWKGAASNKNGLYQQATSGGGEYPFKRIDTLINKHGFVKYWDEIAQAPYLWNADSAIFVSYDDEKSIKKKCDYIKEKNMGGAMFWEYSTDVNNKLLHVIHQELAEPK